MKKYKLLKNIPGLKAGAIFEHDKDDNKLGSKACGCLKLSWINGNCQQSWCGETFIFPGQLVDDDKWFEIVDERKSRHSVWIKEAEDVGFSKKQSEFLYDEFYSLEEI